MKKNLNKNNKYKFKLKIMKKGKQSFELDKVFHINSNLYNTTSFKKDEFKKIENTCFAESVSNKSAIILFQKEHKNKNFNPNKKSNKMHKDKSKKDKRSKTLNNTFYKKNNYLKLSNNNNNNLNNNIIINNKPKFSKKQIKTTNNSSKKYSPNETNKKCKKINKLISGNTNNNITNISVCLTNINMYHKNNENFSPSFYKINKIMKQNAKNINAKNKIRSKTYDYPFGNNDKSISYNSTFTYLENKEHEKNKTLMEKKMRYFLDYCKDDISSILISQGNLDERKNTDDNNVSTSHPKIKKIKNKNKSFSLKNKNRNIHNKYQIDKKKYYLNNNKSYNTFNFDDSHISKNHSIYHSHNISTIKNYSSTNKNYINSLNKNTTTKKKPRVDTFEYLAKILNSINTNNLMKSLQRVKENEINNKNEKKEEKCDDFRKKRNIPINDSINERRFKKKKDIKKYIEVKKKLIKKNDIEKKQKEKDDELRKYIELSKLQESIFNSSGNHFNNINNFFKNKNDDKNKKNNDKDNKNGSNDALYSSESTICDKKNYYLGILDIQNLYNKNNLIKVDKNNDNINYDYDYDYHHNQNYNPNLNQKNDKELYIETNNNEIKSKEMKINKNNGYINNNDNKINGNLNKIGNDKKEKIELNEIDINIIDDNKKAFNINNNLNDKEIYEKCQNTLEKAIKIIGGEKVEYLINNFKNIKFAKNSINEKEREGEGEKENEKEEEKECLINDFKNDYSFKMNDSNENDMNSYKTSKFYNSQVSSEEKRNDQSDDKNDTIKQNLNERSIKNILDNNEKEKEKYETFKGEEDNTYEDNNDINNSEINNENKNNAQNTPSIQIPPTIQLISGSDTLEDKKNKINNINDNNNDNNDNNEQKKVYNFTEEQLEKYKEILSSLNEYLKLITQRNTLNEIITYGDMKYKYKIGIEQLIILIKSMPFNIIRAIQQAQYYNFFFRQLFIPYISRAFNILKYYSFYHQILVKFGQKMKNVLKKYILKEIKCFSDKMKKNKDQIINSNKKSMTIKSLEEISELENSTKNIKDENNIEKKDKNLSSIKSNDKKDENKNKKLSIDNYTEPDISGSKDVDSIDWDNNFINDKQITNRENSKIINSFSKINKKENSYSADFNVSIQEIVFDDQN